LGARPVLFAALGSFVVAGLVASTAQGYAMLLLASLFAGLGNAPFHPVDFTILNKRVSPQRIGHAFSVHGLSGNIGWATAPVFMAGITTATGSWRLACLCGAALAAVVLAIMLVNRRWLDDRDPRPSATRPSPPPPRPLRPPSRNAMAFLKLPSVWLCFSFFFWSTCAMSAIQSFASPALRAIYGLPLSVTALIVTGYMLCGALGMLIGGFLVGRVQRLEKVISICMLGSALLLALVGTGWLPGMGAVVVASIAGLGTGWPALARHADQACGPRRRHRPGLRHRVFGPGPGLLRGRAGVWLDAGPPHVPGHLLRIGHGPGTERGLGPGGGRWRAQAQAGRGGRARRLNARGTSGTMKGALAALLFVMGGCRGSLSSGLLRADALVVGDLAPAGKSLARRAFMVAPSW
jgi:hypothetical protein